MRFEIPTKTNPNLKKYQEQDLHDSRTFANMLFKEFGNFIRAVVIFGSSARGKRAEKGDLDILIVVDDLAIQMTPEVIEAYRIITSKILAKCSQKIHVTSMKFTAFWDYARAGDPVAVNILRDGVALIDSGFFDPLQVLLSRGRIRPSKESVWTYFTRAPRTLYNSRWHLLQATLDLYWAVIDSSHAALMSKGEIPPSPDHVADLLQTRFVNKNLLEQRYVDTMRKFYKLSKMITHREIKDVKGPEFESYHKEANAFVDRMKKFIQM